MEAYKRKQNAEKRKNIRRFCIYGSAYVARLGVMVSPCKNKKTEKADVAKLADAQVSGSCGRPCRFKSCHPHQKESTIWVLSFWFEYRIMTGFEGGAASESERFAVKKPMNEKTKGKTNN